MSLKKEFLEDWENIKNIIKLDIDKNIKLMRPIEPSKLKEKYLDNVKIWEASAMHEGKWLNDIGDPEFKSDFLNILKNINFNYAAKEKKNLPISAIAFVLGIASFCLIKFLLVKSMWLSVITALVIIIAGLVYGKKEKKKNTINYQNEIKSEVVKILEDKGDQIAKACEEFERKQ